MAEIACCSVHAARGVFLAAVRFRAKTTLQISAFRLARVFCRARHDNHKHSHIGWRCTATHTSKLFTSAHMTGSWMIYLAGRSESAWTVSRRVNVPLDLYALSSVYVVAFSVCGKVLGVGRGSRLKILGILGQFQPFGFLPWLITEFYQCHHHGQPQPSDQNIEDTSHIA